MIALIQPYSVVRDIGCGYAVDVGVVVELFLSFYLSGSTAGHGDGTVRYYMPKSKRSCFRHWE